MSNEEAIQAALSASRLGPYEAATAAQPGLGNALVLYAWNAQVSAAMLLPLHIAEVVMRNAAARAIGAVYGDDWPWAPGFERSLPDPATGFSPRRALVAARSPFALARMTGKVIAEMKFIFWQAMFSSRFDERIWNAHLRASLPHADPSRTIGEVRARIHDDLEHLRRLRNRIAHHEPVIGRDLQADLRRIHDLVALRCRATASWMLACQSAAALIQRRPAFFKP